MKILELTNFSAGICGVWARVREEATRLSALGHEVVVFSSNITKGDNKIASEFDLIKDVKIQRFSAKKLGGESYMQWYPSAEKSVINFNPDIIIAHSYRQGHTLQGLKTAKKLGSKIFLVTHAPFIENNSTRSFLAKMAVNYYDSFLGPSRKLNEFDKTIAITKWEVSYLEKLGVKKEKIAYVPNGIPEEFFSMKKLSLEQNKILFLGRIAPIKNLECLIESLALIKNKKVQLEIVGPAEEEYLKKLNGLISRLHLEKRILFSPPLYDLKEKIKKIDSARIFVLPSIRESMPQSLIEAMAREKIVLASTNNGTKELIQDGNNGFLFNQNNARDLADKINYLLSRKEIEVRFAARKSVEQFSWEKVILKLERLLYEKQFCKQLSPKA